jgi:transposase-like protein
LKSIVRTRRGHDATNLFLEGQRISGIVPNVLVTDGLGSYASAFDQTFAKKQTLHIRKPRFIDKANNNMIERLHGTIKERTKTMRALDGSESAKNMVSTLSTQRENPSRSCWIA